MSFILIWNFLAGYRYWSGLNGTLVEAMDANGSNGSVNSIEDFNFNIVTLFSQDYHQFSPFKITVI